MGIAKQADALLRDEGGTIKKDDSQNPAEIEIDADDNYDDADEETSQIAYIEVTQLKGKEEEDFLLKHALNAAERRAELGKGNNKGGKGFKGGKGGKWDKGFEKGSKGKKGGKGKPGGKGNKVDKGGSKKSEILAEKLEKEVHGTLTIFDE